MPFIEKEGQGIEVFLDSDTVSTNSNSNSNADEIDSNSAVPGSGSVDESISNILNTILGTTNISHLFQSSASNLNSSNVGVNMSRFLNSNAEHPQAYRGPIISIISNSGDQTIIRQLPFTHDSGNLNTGEGSGVGVFGEPLPVGDINNLSDILHQILLHEQASGSKQKPITPEALSHYSRLSIMTRDGLKALDSGIDVTPEQLLSESECEPMETSMGSVCANMRGSTNACSNRTGNRNGDIGRSDSEKHHCNDESDIGYCPITHEAFELNDKVLTLTCCNSPYKYESIIEWLKQYNTCPICRQELVV